MRDEFLTAARSAADLVRDSRVSAAWAQPSALPEFRCRWACRTPGVSGAGAAGSARRSRADRAHDPLLEHYARAAWVDAELDDEINVRIREGGESAAAQGPAALAAQLDAVVEELAEVLPGVGNRPVRLPFWGDWSLLLDDLLVTE